MAGKYTCYQRPDADASTDSTFKNWLFAILNIFHLYVLYLFAVIFQVNGQTDMVISKAEAGQNVKVG